jgi:GxxExxY protein
VYEEALVYELSLRNVPAERQRAILVRYKQINIPGQRLDLLVGARVIVELKAVDDFAPIHLAKLMSYMRAMDLRLGLLINFNVALLKDGIRRIVL